MKKKKSKTKSDVDKIAWDILCDPPVLEKLKGDEKFWQLIALARAVNALSFAHWSVLPFWEDGTLQGMRTRNNLFLFTCAALSEGLLLVEKMFVNYQGDPAFADLKTLLKTKTAKKLRNMHLERVRNHMVFHFLPESFGKMVNVPGESMCSFVAGLGNERVQTYYTFADILAIEFFVGRPAFNSEDFYKDLDGLMLGTRQLAADFANAAEKLISQTLLRWGFQMRKQRIGKQLAAAKRKVTQGAKDAGIG
ncbi:MAG TPA: hypothetical protein VGK21_04660 [Candidatus Angelobacter sp.]